VPRANRSHQCHCSVRGLGVARLFKQENPYEIYLQGHRGYRCGELLCLHSHRRVRADPPALSRNDLCHTAVLVLGIPTGTARYAMCVPVPVRLGSRHPNLMGKAAWQFGMELRE
jgi:hypothetical protein